MRREISAMIVFALVAVGCGEGSAPQTRPSALNTVPLTADPATDGPSATEDSLGGSSVTESSPALAESLDVFVERFNAGAATFSADVKIDRDAIFTGTVDTPSGVVDGFYAEIDGANAYSIGVLDGDAVTAFATVLTPSDPEPRAPAAGSLMVANPLLSASPEFTNTWQALMSDGIKQAGYSVFFPGELGPAHPVLLFVVSDSTDSTDTSVLVASGPFEDDEQALEYTNEVLAKLLTLNDE